MWGVLFTTCGICAGRRAVQAKAIGENIVSRRDAICGTAVTLAMLMQCASRTRKWNLKSLSLYNGGFCLGQLSQHAPSYSGFVLARKQSKRSRVVPSHLSIICTHSCVWIKFVRNTVNNFAFAPRQSVSLHNSRCPVLLASRSVWAYNIMKLVKQRCWFSHAFQQSLTASSRCTPSNSCPFHQRICCWFLNARHSWRLLQKFWKTVSNFDISVQTTGSCGSTSEGPRTNDQLTMWRRVSGVVSRTCNSAFRASVCRY